MYVIALYDCETWIIINHNTKRIEAFEMWCWRTIETISRTEKIANKEVLERMKENRLLMSTIEIRRGTSCNFIGHGNVIKGKIEEKRGIRRPRHRYIDQIKEKVAIATYTDVKETAIDKESWMKLHRQERSS